MIEAEKTVGRLDPSVDGLILAYSLMSHYFSMLIMFFRNHDVTPGVCRRTAGQGRQTNPDRSYAEMKITIHKTLETWFASMANWIYTHKYVSLFTMILVTLLFASQLPKLTIDTREESFFHPSDPIITNYNEFRDQFGQDNLFFCRPAA